MPSAPDLGIGGFRNTTITAGPTTYRPGVAGDGPPVPMLGGLPQTQFCWHLVGPDPFERHPGGVYELHGFWQ